MTAFLCLRVFTSKTLPDTTRGSIFTSHVAQLNVQSCSRLLKIVVENTKYVGVIGLQ